MTDDLDGADTHKAIESVSLESTKHGGSEVKSATPSALADDRLTEIEKLLAMEPMAGEEAASSIASLVRDSAIVLAAATALLYLTAHVFGTAYLSFFEVSGFNSFGIATLGMIDYGWILGLVLFTQFTQWALRTPGLRGYLLGIPIILIVSATRPLMALSYGQAVTSSDLPILAAAITVCGVLIPARKRLGPHFAKIEDSLVKAKHALKQVKEKGISDETCEIRILKNITSYLTRRMWQFRVGVWIICGYITMGFAVPAVAWIVAAIAAQQEGYASVDQNSPARVPVYWVGDRVVFLTFDHGCFVYTQVSGTVQSKRSCGRNIRAIVNIGTP